MERPNQNPQSKSKGGEQRNMREKGEDGFVFPLSKAVVLVNDFALRRDILEVLPVPLALAVNNEWVWRNPMAQDATILDRVADADAVPSDTDFSYRHDLPGVAASRTIPVYNLDGQVVG